MWTDVWIIPDTAIALLAPIDLHHCPLGCRNCGKLFLVWQAFLAHFPHPGVMTGVVNFEQIQRKGRNPVKNSSGRGTRISSRIPRELVYSHFRRGFTGDYRTNSEQESLGPSQSPTGRRWMKTWASNLARRTLRLSDKARN